MSRIISITGPSYAGKTTLINHLKEDLVDCLAKTKNAILSISYKDIANYLLLNYLIILIF